MKFKNYPKAQERRIGIKAATTPSSDDDLVKALQRADKLIQKFSEQIAGLTLYDGGYADLNEHFLFMSALARTKPKGA